MYVRLTLSTVYTYTPTLLSLFMEMLVKTMRCSKYPSSSSSCLRVSPLGSLSRRTGVISRSFLASVTASTWAYMRQKETTSLCSTNAMVTTHLVELVPEYQAVTRRNQRLFSRSKHDVHVYPVTRAYLPSSNLYIYVYWPWLTPDLA